MFFLAGPGHDQLATVSIGTGPVTVILAHQVYGSVCQWWPYAQSLITHVRVVAFDFDGCGASPAGDRNYPGEVAAVARWARQHYGGRIVLMGASMGATAVLVAAASLGTSISGAIYFSGPAQFEDMDALAAARRVHVPVLFGYGTQDLSFATDVVTVRSATATHDKPVVTVSNTDHGVDLVDPSVGSPNIRSAVLSFITAVTR